VQALQDVTILIMASLAETRDNETGNHILRTQHYVKLLAEYLAPHPRFAATLTPRYITQLFKSAPLHDIGKSASRTASCLPGKLDADEFEIMKTHTTLGRNAIVHAEQGLGVSVPFLQTAKEICYSHQEKWMAAVIRKVCRAMRFRYRHG
jgi:putative two-component system response regulator